MAEFPKFPLWTDAYLGDTTHLRTLEHGAYLLLLIAMWRSPGQTLPNDDRLLARYAKLTDGEWRKIKPIILPFFTVEGDRLTQGRLRDEATAAADYAKKQSGRAKGRWLKNKDTAHATASPTASARECRGNASQSLSHTEETKSVSSVRSRKRAKTRMNPEAVISEQMRAAAEQRGLSDAEAEAQFAKFRDWAMAKGQAYVDWDAAWRNWLSSAYFAPVLGAVHPFPGRRKSDAERLDDHLDALKAHLTVNRLE